MGLATLVALGKGLVPHPPIESRDIYGSANTQVVGKKIAGRPIAECARIFFWRMEIALLKSVGLD
jgi:hypothetical protein